MTDFSAVCAKMVFLPGLLVIAASTAPLAASQLAPIPLDQIGQVAESHINGEGLSVTACGDATRLECAHQRLEGDASRGGLWIRSTTETDGPGQGLRVMATSLGREGCPPHVVLPDVGNVHVAGQCVRFVRPGLMEEYSVSVDGVRQDFVVSERPAGAGDVLVELSVQGGRAEKAARGARLILDDAGRILVYSRLCAIDATGRELAARMEVLSADRMVVQVDDTEATYPVRIDPTFSDADWVSMNSLPGMDGWVFAIVADASGNLYVGGSFDVAGSVVANDIAMWDGSEWSALGAGMGGHQRGAYRGVWALAIRGTDLYAVGDFTTAGGTPANRIAKWDGSEWSALGSGLGGTGDFLRASSLAMIGTDIYVGGSFSTAGDLPANHIAKWDGSSWSALGVGADGTVDALAAIGTDLYAGGSFTTAGGVSVNHIAKWNGSTWSALGSGVAGAHPGYDTEVAALAVSGTDLYAGGNFTSAGSVPANHIARWDGNSWSGLGSGLGALHSYDPRISALAVIGTDLYAGGKFNTAGGSQVNYIAKWDGSAWTALGSGMGDRVADWVWSLGVIGTDLYVGGEFTKPSGVPARHIAKWDGSQWSALGTGMHGEQEYCGARVDALVVSGIDLYVGGDLATTPDGVPANSIAKWDGNAWSTLGSGIEDGVVLALAVSGSDLYVGGIFTTAGGVPANSVAKWDGSGWSALGSGVGGAYPEVYALAVIGPDLYAGGLFTTAGGVTVNCIARWDGTRWSALGSGIDDPFPFVEALAVRGSVLYVGGSFTVAGGVPVNNIARWDGNAWSALGSGIEEGGILALATSETGLYAAGGFTTAGGTPANNIARWDGNTWSALDPGSSGIEWNYITALTASGNDVYAGGWSPGPRSMIARWDGSKWSALGSGMSREVSALAADSNGHLFAGGNFVLAGTTVSPYIAQANVTGLDFTWSTVLSPQEVSHPFPVTLTARRADGEVCTSFTDTVTLSGYAPGLVTTNLNLGTGTGTAMWGYPLHARYHDARTQVIYPAGDLGLSCSITSLALEVVTPPGQTLENWTIRIRHTSLAEYPASPEWEGGGWTVVYQGNEPAGDPGWRSFAFSTPFEYNGTNNLLVDFSCNNNSYSSEGQCHATDTGIYRSITYVSDSADGDPLGWVGPSPSPLRHQTVPNLVLGATFPGTLPLSVLPPHAGPFVNGGWTGEVTITDAYAGVILRADDGLGHAGESNPFDVEAVVVLDTDEDGLDDAWELAHFPSLTNISFHSDWDGDGFRDGFEHAGGTRPTDPNSYLGITSVEVNTAGTEAVIRWSSESNQLYSVYAASNLIHGIGALLEEHIPATYPVNIYTDTLDGVDSRSYGVEVER